MTPLTRSDLQTIKKNLKFLASYSVPNVNVFNNWARDKDGFIYLFPTKRDTNPLMMVQYECIILKFVFTEYLLADKNIIIGTNFEIEERLGSGVRDVEYFNKIKGYQSKFAAQSYQEMVAKLIDA